MWPAAAPFFILRRCRLRLLGHCEQRRTSRGATASGTTSLSRVPEHLQCLVSNCHVGHPQYVRWFVAAAHCRRGLPSPSSSKERRFTSLGNALDLRPPAPLEKNLLTQPGISAPASPRRQTFRERPPAHFPTGSAPISLNASGNAARLRPAKSAANLKFAGSRPLAFKTRRSHRRVLVLLFRKFPRTSSSDPSSPACRIDLTPTTAGLSPAEKNSGRTVG